MTTPIGFLALPGPGDTTAQTLADRVRTVAFKRLVTCDRRALSPATAAALAPLQARLHVQATRDAAARAALALRFADLDVQTAALALDGPPAIAEEAAALLLALLAQPAPAPAATIAPTATAPLAAVAPADAALHPITAALPALRLALVDRNPLRSLEAHPDKHGNAIDLGDRPLAAWIATLADAIAAIGAALPALLAELAVTLRRIIPVGVDPIAHLSCSYREAPGLIYLSLHPSLLTMAEAIVHETQHTKLHLLSWLDPLLTNPPDQHVASPARPDPRPLFGVLLAAHAFVPVAGLHHALAAIAHPLAREPGFAERRRRVLADNAAALATLHAHARPTPTGGRVIAALDGIHAALS